MTKNNQTKKQKNVYLQQYCKYCKVPKRVSSEVLYKHTYIVSELLEVNVLEMMKIAKMTDF